MLDAKLAEILTQIQLAVQQYGPAAVGITLQLIQLTAILHLLTGFIFAGMAILGIRLTRQAYKTFEEKADSYDTPVLPILTGIGTLIASILSLVLLCSTGDWIAAFNPRLGLAWMILHKVL